MADRTDEHHPPSADATFDPLVDVYQGLTWSERARRFGTLGSALDPGDRTGRKNRYIDRLQRRVLRETLGHEVEMRGSLFSKALDYGCGGGRLTQELLRFAVDVYGVDPSDAMIALAKREAGVDPERLTTWRTGPLPFDDAYFDLFISVYVTLKPSVLDHLASSLPRVCADEAVGLMIEQVDEPRGLTLERYVETLRTAGLEVRSATPLRRSARSPFRRLATFADWPGWVLDGLVRCDLAVTRRRRPRFRGPGYYDYAIVVRRT